MDLEKVKNDRLSLDESKMVSLMIEKTFKEFEMHDKLIDL